MTDLLLNNARLVLGREVLRGHLRVQGGLITDIGQGLTARLARW